MLGDTCRGLSGQESAKRRTAVKVDAVNNTRGEKTKWKKRYSLILSFRAEGTSL